VYEYLLPTYCLLPPASDDALAQHLDASSPGWREGLGEAAAFADAGITEDEPAAEEKTESTERKPVVEGEEDETRGKFGPRKAGEFERRRGWRCDAATLGRFRALIKEFVGTQ